MKYMKLRVWMLLPMSLLALGCSGGPNPTSSESAAPTQSSTAAANPVSSDPMQNKGLGPVTSLTLEPINQQLVKEGQALFKKNCTACHKMDKRRVGPALAGVTARRTPEWIMNMVLNPTEMLEKDPIAKELLAEYATQMANMNVTEAQARAILEYLRTKEDPHAKD